MKKLLVFVAIMLFATLGSVSYANDGDSKIKITEIKHEKYVNVVEINITSEEPILYVSFINPEGEVLYSEKVNTTNFTKKISLQMENDQLRELFTFQVISEGHVIKYDFRPSKIFSKK